jgi:hypothetical protein
MPVSRRVFLRMLGLALASEALTGCWHSGCYTATPMPKTPVSLENLRVQAELLAEMGEQGGLEAETVARARVSVQRDLAFLARSDGDK